MKDFAKDLRDVLEGAGCAFARQGKGSHEIWKSPRSPKPFTVPTSVKSRHMANAILKQAGLPKAF